MGEHIAGSDEVTGSSPVLSTDHRIVTHTLGTWVATAEVGGRPKSYEMRVA